MSLKKYQDNFIIPRDKIKTNSSKVGEAVFKILSQDPKEDMTVQDVMEGMEAKYTQEMERCIRENIDKYDPPFYIVVLTKKEPWTTIVLRNWFVARQTRPKAKWLRQEFPNHMNTVYSFNGRNGELKILWSLPTKQDASVVLKNKRLYDHILVKWIQDYEKGILDPEFVVS